MCHWKRILCFATVCVTVTGAPACASGCDPELIDRAATFREEHLSCDTDADCTVVSDTCAELPSGYCGQLPMNRDGAESAEWQALARELEDCGPKSCTVCDALLIVKCKSGVCSRG